MKKLDKNQSGFSAVEILLIFVIIAVLGVVGWLVYDKNRTKPTPISNTATTTTPKTTTTKTTPEVKNKTYTDSIAGYSFEYPETWSISVKKDKGYYNDTLTYFNIVAVKSPDYKDNGVSLYDMGNVILKGGRFMLQSTPPPSDTSICQQGQKCVTVDGQKAEQHTYNPGPEGGYWVSTTFYKSNSAYDISYIYTKGQSDQYSSEYDDLLDSFKTN